MTTDWQMMRASDADRHRALDVLKAAVSEGRLTWDEHEDRLRQVMTAKTYGQLQEVVADLPAGVMPGPAQQPLPVETSPPAQPPARPKNTFATTSLVLGLVGMLTYGASSVPAIITGYLAMNRIRQTGEEGHGLAIAGIILGYVGAAILVARMIVFVTYGL